MIVPHAAAMLTAPRRLLNCEQLASPEGDHDKPSLLDAPPLSAALCSPARTVVVAQLEAERLVLQHSDYRQKSALLKIHSPPW